MFEFIENESQILGYRIARGNLNSIENIEALQFELQKNKIDVLKLSIRNPNANFYSILDSLNLSYYVLGITLEFKSFFSRNPKNKEYLNTGVTFKDFVLSEKPILEELVKKIFQEETTSYFKNPALQRIDDKEKRLTCLANYIATFCKELDSNKYTHIMYHKNKPIGFITSYKDNENSGGGVLYAGILNNYIGRGFYIDLVRFIQNYGKGIGQKWGLAYVQIHHTVVQKTFVKEGLVPQGYLLNVHVNSNYGNLKS